MLAEVKQTQKTLTVQFPANAKYAIAASIKAADFGIRSEDPLRGPNGFQLSQGRKKSALTGCRVSAKLCLFPVKISTVEVAAVCALFLVEMVVVIVQLSDFVTAVENGNAALGQHPGVEHDITGKGQLRFLRGLRGFQTAQRCCGAAQAGIPQPGIVVVQFSPGTASGPFPGKPVVQILFMGYFLYAELPQPGIIQTPANVIVAAQVILEQAVCG